jgi:predicted dienelactone hydrolase
LPEANNSKKCPIVLLSHGLGGSREGFPYLGQYWSKHGYIVIAMQHPDSDVNAIQRRPGKTVAEVMSEAVHAENAQARVDDVKFVLDELERRSATDTKLKGRLDLDNIAIGGHSFGAHTTLSVVGRFPFVPEPRIKSAIAMSPAHTVGVQPGGEYRNVKVPVFHLTGTKDFSPIRPETKPEDRRIPFDNIGASGQYLVIFKDGDHMLFSGHARPFGLNRMERDCQPMIQEMTLKFLDATLRKDADAEKWLTGSACTELLGGRATFEKKH